MSEGERRIDDTREQVSKDIARIDHFLNDFVYDPDPEVFVSRQVRKQWQASQNPEDRKKLERYEKNMHRSNNIQPIVMAIELFAEEYFSGTDLETKYKDIAKDIVNRIHEAGAPKGKPVSTQIVQRVRETLIDLRENLSQKQNV